MLRIYTLLKMAIPQIVIGSETSYVKLGRLLIHWGTGIIIPNAANTSATQTVKFIKTYSQMPIVVVGLGAQPSVDRLIISCASTTTSGWVCHINASNTTSRRFYWISIGVA